jgi:hypothetical protein
MGNPRQTSLVPFQPEMPDLRAGDRLHAASGRYRSLTNYTFMQGTGAWQPDIGEAAVFQ